MSNTRQQVPSNIYWRRRLTVLGGLVILIVVVVLIIVRPGFGGPGTPEPEPEVAVEVIKPPSCLPSQIELVAMTDQSSYDAGLNPQLWLGRHEHLKPGVHAGCGHRPTALRHHLW